MGSSYLIATKGSEFYSRLYDALILNQRYLLYLEGLSNTLKMAAMGTAIGIILGLIIASVKFSRKSNILTRILAFIFDIYTTIIRGTPVLLQLMIIWTLIFTSRNANSILAGGLCFGINSGAYVSEIFRGAISSINKGQMEAGRSLGLSHFQTMKSIIIPQAFKNAIPALGNEFIMLIKETSVGSIIGSTELMKVAKNIGNITWDFLPPLYIVACIYLALVMVLQKIQSRVERRLQKDA